MRGVYKVLVGFLIALILGGLLLLSIFIVNRGYKEERQDSTRLTFVDGDDFLGHMKKMYNEKTITSDMKEFLGEDYKSYKGILKKIKKEHK